MYWLGTEPFLYIADPEFLKKMSSEVLAKRWGKPSVFRNDRDAMFGSGLVMVEGNDWVRHRHIVAPAFSPLNLKVPYSLSLSFALLLTSPEPLAMLITRRPLDEVGCTLVGGTHP